MNIKADFIKKITAMSQRMQNSRAYYMAGQWAYTFYFIAVASSKCIMKALV